MNERVEEKKIKKEITSNNDVLYRVMFQFHYVPIGFGIYFVGSDVLNRIFQCFVIEDWTDDWKG